MKAQLRAALAACALLAGLPAHAEAPDPLIGLWRYQAPSEALAHGALRVTHKGQVWRAAIAGHSASARASGRELRLVFPDRLGEFRGRLGDHGRILDGFWLQPASGSGDAGGASQAFALPLRLRAIGPNAWRGEVRPLPNPFTIYLKVFRDADGTLVAAFRNPEANSTGGRTQFLVSREGEKVRFATRPAEGQRPIAFDAQFSGERLHLVWPDRGRAIDLVRPTPQQAAAFFPRPPGEPAYAYRAPPKLNDGWSTARAASVGLDEAALARIVQAQASADPAARRPSLVHSILVARRGKLVLEEYFFSYSRDTPHDLRSAAKTFGSVMLGAVMLHDPGVGPQSRIYDLLAGQGPFANPDPRKAQITLAHLMTHTSGLACDDNDDASPGNEETMQRQSAQPNWWKYTLDLPVAHDPGTRYAYCSANANLTGAALTARTHTWLPELFDRTVARPLQFGPYYWNLMPTGEGYAGGGAFLRPRDLLKVGQTFLDGGVWRGRRVVGADWVRLSTSPHADINPKSTGLDAEAFTNAYIEAQDGYAWHLNSLKVGDRTYRDYEATGNGGQLLIVVPEADLAVVITAGNYGQGGIWTRWRDSIVAQQIIPAIR